jgi:hypothetical protein
VRRLLVLLVALPLVAAACGGSGASDEAATPSAPATTANLARATQRTMADGSARFTLDIEASLGGAAIETQSRGSVSFRARRAHVFKLIPGIPYPQEEIVDGATVYRNSNVVGALSDPTLKPWTKVDTTSLPAAQQLAELDHVRALAYLPSGARAPERVGTTGALTHFRGQVDADRVLARVPAKERPTVRAVLAADYDGNRFPADFWLDGRSRLRRVRVAYTTPQGSRFKLVGTFSGFGSPVDVTPPPAHATEVVAP